MPEQHDRTNPAIAIRVITLLMVMVFVGLFPVFVSPARLPAQAQTTGQAVQQTAQQTTQQTVIGSKCQRCH